MRSAHPIESMKKLKSTFSSRKGLGILLQQSTVKGQGCAEPRPQSITYITRLDFLLFLFLFFPLFQK